MSVLVRTLICVLMICSILNLGVLVCIQWWWESGDINMRASLYDTVRDHT